MEIHYRQRSLHRGLIGTILMVFSWAVCVADASEVQFGIDKRLGVDPEKVVTIGQMPRSQQIAAELANEKALARVNRRHNHRHVFEVRDDLLKELLTAGKLRIQLSQTEAIHVTRESFDHVGTSGFSGWTWRGEIEEAQSSELRPHQRLLTLSVIPDRNQIYTSFYYDGHKYKIMALGKSGLHSLSTEIPGLRIDGAVDSEEKRNAYLQERERLLKIKRQRHQAPGEGESNRPN